MMVEATGSPADRKYAFDVAEWCSRELAKARATGDLETRPFVQNADLIIAALREYSQNDGLRSLAGAVSQGQTFDDLRAEIASLTPKSLCSDVDKILEKSKALSRSVKAMGHVLTCSDDEVRRMYRERFGDMTAPVLKASDVS